MKTLFLISTLLVSVLACCEDSKPANIGFNTQLNQRTDQDGYSQIISKLNNDQPVSDSFYLRSADIVDSTLHINVQYSGGCQEHTFELIWPEVITMIYPPQFDLILTHQGNGDSCEAFISETLMFDLSQNGLGISADIFQIMKIGIINASNLDEIVYPNE